MPNGGITPDCYHCELFTGRPHTEEDSYCTYHKISLPNYLRTFCANFVDVEPEDGMDWLDEMLDRDELQADLMYIWLGGWDIEFYYVRLVSVIEFGQWTPEKFAVELEKVSGE